MSRLTAAMGTIRVRSSSAKSSKLVPGGRSGQRPRRSRPRSRSSPDGALLSSAAISFPGLPRNVHSDLVVFVRFLLLSGSCGRQARSPAAARLRSTARGSRPRTVAGLPAHQGSRPVCRRRQPLHGVDPSEASTGLNRVRRPARGAAHGLMVAAQDHLDLGRQCSRQPPTCLGQESTGIRGCRRGRRRVPLHRLIDLSGDCFVHVAPRSTLSQLGSYLTQASAPVQRRDAHDLACRDPLFASRRDTP